PRREGRALQAGQAAEPARGRREDLHLAGGPGLGDVKAPAFTAPAAWIVLAILAAGRILAIFPRSMWAWGLNAPRFLSPALAWSALGLLALALLPPVGVALAPALSSLGALLARSRVARLAAAALAALLAWGMADRLWFLGDFMMRQGAIMGE